MGGGLHQVDFRVGDMTGERLGFVEASIALVLVEVVHKDDFALWLPAEQIGDVGAALPACMAVATIIAFTKAYAPGPKAILFCAGLGDTRSACVLAASVE